MLKRVGMYLLLGMALGCSEPEDAAAKAPAPAQENVFKSQTEAIDKAKAAEQEMEAAAARQKQAIEDQEP